MDQINVGIIGYGVVGCGTLALLQKNAELIANRIGCPLKVLRVADLDLERPRPVVVDRALLTRDAMQLVTDPAIHIVVEVMGGVEPARQFVMEAIRHGKSVVTSNKELIAKCGSEILDAAKEHRVDVNFEGSVGGGIPIIQPLKQGLAANRIRQIIGIVNGTTNYILTQMTREHRDFNEVLKEAQQKGYAESDPTNDIEGFDAAYKIAILTAIAFGKRVRVEDVYREGISQISAKDIQYAGEFGYTIKLLAIASEENGKLAMRVHPAMLPQQHPLAGVNDVFNAILVEGDAVGRVMFYGRGAGSDPTGSAVVGDIMDIARNIRCGSTGRVPCTCSSRAEVKPMAEVMTKLCIRMQVTDQPGVLARIASVFGEEQVSILSVLQRGSSGEVAEIVWVTHQVPQQNVTKSIKRIVDLAIVKEVSSVIRVEGE